MGEMRTEQSLFDAAIESATIFNQVAVQCSVSGHLVEAMQDFVTVGTVMERMQFHESKQPAVEALLKVLADTSTVEQQTVGSQTIYRTNQKRVEEQHSLDGSIQRYRPRFDILAPWYGEEHTDLIHASNHALLSDDLAFFRSPTTKIRFDRSFLESWKTNLSNPLYEYGRALAVSELVKRGNRFLDLACGLGYGAQRLAEYSPAGCKIVGIDLSQDMLDQARMVMYPNAQVQFIRRDLNTGLPPFPPASFDGVLFNGSFHFMKDKRARLRELYRVIRPGGLLVIGHCFCRSNFADEPMHELYFSLLENPIWLIPFSALQALLTEAGFREIHQYHRGSHSYILAERLADATVYSRDDAVLEEEV